MEQLDWLSAPTDTAPVSAEPDYLALPGVDPLALDTPSVEVARADAPAKDIRFQVMSGTDRVWACNGRYVACRPDGFNPTTRQRHSRFLASGHYKHVGTYDDVQLFELQPGSPFYRTPGDVRAGSWYELLRAASQAAVARDWGAYVDLLEEIATRLKSTPTGTQSQAVEPTLAKERFFDTLGYIEQLIFMRWHGRTPMQKVEDYGLAMSAMKAEIDAGVANIRARRGAPRSRTIALPGPMRIQ